MKLAILSIPPLSVKVLLLLLTILAKLLRLDVLECVERDGTIG